VPVLARRWCDPPPRARCTRRWREVSSQLRGPSTCLGAPAPSSGVYEWRSVGWT